jgi:hypothetical protein
MTSTLSPIYSDIHQLPWEWWLVIILIIVIVSWYISGKYDFTAKEKE